MEHWESFISISLIFSLYFSSNLGNVRGFDSLIELPHSGNRSRAVERKRVFNINDFGAKGDGFTDDSSVFMHVWKKACSSKSQSEIFIPAGSTYLVPPIELSGSCKSNMTLRISGTIIAPELPDAWEGMDRQKWIYFHGVNNLTIEGGGIIDGMGHEWWARSCKINKTRPCEQAPTALTFHRCSNLHVSNLMIINSQKMQMAFTHCVGVVASNLTVLAPADSPNTDGIHISASTQVKIEDSTIGTGDDCISIVRNSSNIWIGNITCGPGHGISIGSLGESDSWTLVHDVIVHRAFLSKTKNGVRIKTWQGGSGFATRIRFEDVQMENVSNPIIIDQYYCDSEVPCQNETSAVRVDNISFLGVKGTSATRDAIKFACSDASPCENLYLEDILLVSDSGKITSSFCWNARGSSSGFVYPPPCLSCSGSLIEQVTLPSSDLQTI